MRRGRRAALSIRDLDDEVRNRLRRRAADNGRSMEAEARAILAAAVFDEDQDPLDEFFTRVRVIGVELEVPRRAWSRRAPQFP